MRVLQVMAGKGNGGAELYSTDVMLSLHEAGLDQCVVMRPGAPRFGELAAAGLRMAPEVLAVPVRPWQKLQMRRLIAREKPDIIHCWMRRAASLVAPTPGVEIIGWYGDYEEQQKYFSHCTQFVGVTRDLVRHARENGATERNSFYVPTFPSVEDTPALDRAALGTPEDARVLLTLSRLHQVKGLDTTLYAMAALPDCYLWVAGDGPMDAELKTLAANLGIAERVKFLGWRTDRGALLRAADICLLPSRYEPFGTVILDAWSTGTALIACESDGPSAYIRNGENGMLVPANRAPALAAAIREVLDNDALRQRIAATGHAEFLAGFTRSSVTQQMLACYRTILAGQQRTNHAA